jgi:hypothetical protein
MFIYIDINYFNFYYDTRLSFAILQFKEIGANSLHIEWLFWIFLRKFEVHGEEMFIMCRIRRQDLALDTN